MSLSTTPLHSARAALSPTATLAYLDSDQLLWPCHPLPHSISSIHRLLRAMLPFTILAIFVLSLTSFTLPTQSAPTHNWAGADSFFLYAMSDTDRVAHLSAMHDAGMKVVRIFISGVGRGAKGSSATDVPDLEPETVGVYNDTILERVDQLLYEAVSYGIKLDMSATPLHCHMLSPIAGALVSLSHFQRSFLFAATLSGCAVPCMIAMHSAAGRRTPTTTRSTHSTHAPLTQNQPATCAVYTPLTLPSPVFTVPPPLQYRFPDGTGNGTCNAQKNDVHAFYQNASIEAEFDNRLLHMITHRNPLLGNRTWGELDEAIFTFAPQNEAQSFIPSRDWQWACRRAQTMRPYVVPGILLSTNGATVDDSLQEELFKCDELDVMAVHNYGGGETVAANYSQTAVALANQYNKRVYVEEFGSQGDNETRAAGLAAQIDGIMSAHIPWMFWELVKGSDPTNDFELWTDSLAWTVLTNRSLTAAADTEGAFAWPELFGNQTGASKEGGEAKARTEVD